MSFLNKNKIVGLAPMDGITDEVFRLVQIKIAKPEVIFTEFVSAEGISRGGIKLYDNLLFSIEERPIIGQLFGKDPESFYKSAIILCELGFDGIDINMGCPAKTVTQHGSGAALIGQNNLASQIIKSVKSGIDDWFSKKNNIENLGLNQKTLDIIKKNKKSTVDHLQPTISVKTRLGIAESQIDSWIPFLLDQGLDFITLHGRTLKQGYAGTANWNEIEKAVNFAKNYSTKIWGNGDIQSRKQGLEFCQKYGVSGVLIGRAACGNPWVFTDHIPSFKEKFSAMLLHTQLFQQIFPNRQFDIMRKFFLFYASGHPNAKQLRSKLVRVNSLSELLALEQEFVTC